jgi:Tfp pilus assembly protein FimT
MPASEKGFSLVETLLVVLIISGTAVSAMPGASTAFRRYQLDSARSQIAAQVRSARLRAVTANQTMRVRFNCPAPGQMRVVQLVGNPTVDDGEDRCSAAVYPYPDRNVAVEPNHDGPVMTLPGGSVSTRTPRISIFRRPGGSLRGPAGSLWQSSSATHTRPEAS